MSEAPPLPRVQRALTSRSFSNLFPSARGLEMGRAEQYCSETRPGAPLPWAPSSSLNPHITAQKCKDSFFIFITQLFRSLVSEWGVGKTLPLQPLPTG